MVEVIAGITVSPEIFSVLGAQLVSDPITALSELIKNSYDADAENVGLKFLGGRSGIVVEDDGVGMSLDDIRRGWLQIGTPLKRRTSTSPVKRRVLVGSMGIGRLSAFSIADTITIQTGHAEDWFEYTISFSDLIGSTSLSDIKIPIRRIPGVKQHGTIIGLSKLKWWPTEEEINQTRIRLSVLASPTGTKDFSIFLQFDDSKTPIEPEANLPSCAYCCRGLNRRKRKNRQSFEG